MIYIDLCFFLCYYVIINKNINEGTMLTTCEEREDVENKEKEEMSEDEKKIMALEMGFPSFE